MRASNVSNEEQYRLIMECRSSGLTDYQWCLEHDIKPGTFYNWVKRLRKSGCSEIPAATRCRKSGRQDVVRIEFDTPAEIYNPAMMVAPVTHEQKASVPATIEVIMSDRVIRISNGADPVLLEQTLRMLGGMSC